MTFRKSWAIHLPVLLLLLLQCSDNPTKPLGASLDDAFSLAIDQGTNIDSESLEVVFSSLVSDTRCPNPESCHNGDMAEISVRLTLGEDLRANVILRIPSNPSHHDIEALAVDTMGYRLRLLQLTIHEGQSTRHQSAVAEITVSKAVSRPAGQIDSLRIVDESIGTFQRLPVNVDTAYIDSDTLIVVAAYGGGCGNHYFSLFMSPATFVDGDQPRANLHLRHLSGRDACDGVIKQELRFLLAPLKTVMTSQFGDSAYVQLNIGAYTGAGGEHTSVLYYGTPPQPINHPPTIGGIDDQTIEVSQTLKLRVSASDPDLTIPALTTGALPDNAAFVDFGTGQGELTYSPLAPAIGNHIVEIIASDGIDADTELISIEVLPENFAPIITAPDSAVVAEGDSLFLTVSAMDPNGTIPGIRLSRPLPNMKIIVHHDGTATLEFRPSFFQAGTHGLYIIASDMALEDSSLLVVRVPNTNRAPVLTAPEILNTWFDYEVTANLSATDPDSEAISIFALNLPANVTLTDNENGTASLKAKPEATQFGVYDIPVIATDGDMSDTATIELAVLGTYPGPKFVPVPPQTVMEGDTLRVLLEAQYTILVPYISFVGSSHNYFGRLQMDERGNGKSLFTLVPRFVDAGVDTFYFDARDRQMSDRLMLIVTVVDAPNQAPKIIGPVKYQSVAVGQTYSIEIKAYDPDASGIATIAASGLPPGSSLSTVGANTSRFIYTPHVQDTGTYTVMFEAHDFADPGLIGTLAIELNVDNFQENEGQIIPLEIGRYWIYEHRYTATCSPPGWGWHLSPSSSQSFVQVDSIEVVDSVRVNGYLQWRLSPPLPPLGGQVLVRGDTVLTDHFIKYFFPVAQMTTISHGTAQPTSVVAPTGAYLNGYKFDWRPNGIETNSQTVILAPAVGIVRTVYSVFGTPMSCEHYGCCFSTDSYLLIRTGRR